MKSLRYSPVDSHVGYNAIGAQDICRVAVTAVTDAVRAELTWSGVLVMVVRWMFGGVGCHATSKGAE